MRVLVRSERVPWVEVADGASARHLRLVIARAAGLPPHLLWLKARGKALPDAQSLASLGLQDGALVDANLRVLGGGGGGGVVGRGRGRKTRHSKLSPCLCCDAGCAQGGFVVAIEGEEGQGQYILQLHNGTDLVLPPLPIRNPSALLMCDACAHKLALVPVPANADAGAGPRGGSPLDVLDRVLEGNADVLVQRAAENRAALQDVMDKAYIDKDKMVHAARGQCKYDKNLADKEYQQERNQLRHRLVHELQEQAKRRELSDHEDHPGNGGVGRRVRPKKAYDSERDELGLFRARATFPFAEEVLLALSERQGTEDLHAIYRLCSRSGRGVPSRPSSAASGESDRNVRVEDDVLYFGDAQFDVGCEIVMHSCSSHHRYSAEIVALTPYEVVLKRGDGTRSRISLVQLRSGKWRMTERS